MNDNVEYYSGSQDEQMLESKLKSGRSRRFFRLFMIAFGVIILGVFLGIVGLFFLFQGGAIENEALNNRVERSLTTFLGSQFNVELGATKFEFHGLGKISITSSNVKVIKIGETGPVAVFGRVLVGVSPVSLLRGKPKIHNVTIDSSKLELRQFLPPSRLDFPKDMNKVLTGIGQSLELIQKRFVVSELKNITIKNSVLTGFKPGRKSTGTINIDELDLKIKSSDKLNIHLAADKGISNFNVDAEIGRAHV